MPSIRCDSLSYAISATNTNYLLLTSNFPKFSIEFHYKPRVEKFLRKFSVTFRFPSTLKHEHVLLVLTTFTASLSVISGLSFQTTRPFLAKISTPQTFHWTCLKMRQFLNRRDDKTSTCAMAVHRKGNSKEWKVSLDSQTASRSVLALFCPSFIHNLQFVTKGVIKTAFNGFDAVTGVENCVSSQPVVACSTRRRRFCLARGKRNRKDEFLKFLAKRGVTVGLVRQ